MMRFLLEIWDELGYFVQLGVTFGVSLGDSSQGLSFLVSGRVSACRGLTFAFANVGFLLFLLAKLKGL